MKGERLFMAIDAGTTKVCALAAVMTEKGPQVLAAGSAPARGIKKGVVVNIDEAAESVKRAADAAEASSGKKMKKALVGISGQHIAGVPSTGVIGLQGREITPDDRARAIDSAKTLYIPLEREVLHVIPSEFILDGQKEITDPVGMSGVRLESKVYIVTALAQAVQNLEKACEKAGLEVLEEVFSPAATALATLTTDEIGRGALLIDIGGGTTDIALFRDGALVHAAVLGIGGLHITNDLAVCLNVSGAEAEKLKITAGAARLEHGHEAGVTQVPVSGDPARKISRRQMASIIQPRCEELFEMIVQEIRRAFPKGPVPCSAVLTGGTALLENISGLAASVLGMPVRLGMPQGISGMKGSLRDPAYAVVVGLLAYAFEHESLNGICLPAGGSIIGSMKKRVKDLTGYKEFLEMMQKKKKGVSYV
jgi:cell division protein FtsA